MQLLFDNLAATLIATTISMMLLTVHQRKQEAQVKATGFYVLRKQQIAFIETLRGDMAGMICDEENPENTCPDLKEDPSDQTYTFYSRLGKDETVHKVVYKRRKVGEAKDGTDLYQIQRYEDPSGSLDPNDYDGGSMPTITSWKIYARGPEGEEITMRAEAHQIDVRFETIPPFSDGEDLEPNPWETTYRPTYLRENNTL